MIITVLTGTDVLEPLWWATVGVVRAEALVVGGGLARRVKDVVGRGVQVSIDARLRRRPPVLERQDPAQILVVDVHDVLAGLIPRREEGTWIQQFSLRILDVYEYN